MLVYFVKIRFSAEVFSLRERMHRQEKQSKLGKKNGLRSKLHYTVTVTVRYNLCDRLLLLIPL